MRRRGFTIVEILVCLAIIAILAGLLTPVLRKVKRNAQITNSLSNLRQFHLALKMYQADNNGDGKYGTLGEMGLPVYSAYRVFEPYGISIRSPMWSSSCGQNYKWIDFPLRVNIDFFPHSDQRKFPAYARDLQENLLTYYDMHCTDDFEDIDNPYLPHRGLGVLLSGQLLNLKKPGNVRDPYWWSK